MNTLPFWAEPWSVLWFHTFCSSFDQLHGLQSLPIVARGIVSPALSGSNVSWGLAVVMAPFVPHWMLMALAKAVKKLGKCPFEMATFGGGLANVALDGLGLWSHSWFHGALLRDLGVVDCEIWASRDFLAISLLGHKRCGGGPTLGGFGSASKAVGEVLASPLALDASTSCAGKRMGAPLFARVNCRKTSYLPGKNQDCITVCCIGMQHMIE